VFRRALYLAQLLHNESLPPATLRARQDRALRQLVRGAAVRVPFYRDMYARSGVDAAGFQGLDELAQLPIIDKAMLRSAGDGAVAFGAPAQRVRISTSGSTGEPFEFPIDRRYDQWRKAQYLRPYLRNGRRLQDKVLRLTAFPSSRTPWFSRLGLLREWQFSCAAEPAQIVAAWRSLRPAVLQGYPSSLRALAHYCLDSGESLDPAPRLLFTDSELLSPDTRSLLERVFGVAVIDIFGTYETDNIAYQCVARNGYHVATDCAVLELVRDGKPVAPGQEGELVVTVLANHTSPFIRYNLRDLGRLSGTPCPCGSPFPLLLNLAGRADDLILRADGSRRSPMAVLGLLDGFVDAILHYQLRQLAVRRFELLIAPSTRFAEVGTQALVSAVDAALEHPQLEVKLVAAFPPDPSGKRRAFVSELAREHA
jgi:phenylacetate-CoA ligase